MLQPERSRFKSGRHAPLPVDEVESGVAGVVGDHAPVFRVLHAVDDGPVTSGRFAEAAAVLAARERAELAVDEGDDLAREVIRIVTDRRGLSRFPFREYLSKGRRHMCSAFRGFLATLFQPE